MRYRFRHVYQDLPDWVDDLSMRDINEAHASLERLQTHRPAPKKGEVITDYWIVEEAP